MNVRGQVTSGHYGGSISAGFGFDNYGFPTSITAGNGNSLQNFTYNFNSVTGNLNWRQDNNGSELKETFNYDNLDRLDNVYKGVSNPTMSMDMAYDATKGGITTKTDVGTLQNNVSGKPYALGSVNPSTGVIPAVLDSVTYNSFESVNTISEGNYSATFVYNPENERAKMEIKQNGSTILTRWYLGSDYIKETSGGVTKEYTFIGGDAYTAKCVAVKQQGIPIRFYYLLRDHLGRITGVADSTGALLYQYCYDSWGRMRNTSNWLNYTPGSEPSLFIDGRGFSGHEHLPWFSVINMNGRLYDPLAGQFLSPDNNVQCPGFTQGFNRYSYCLNNPLSCTDPTGNKTLFGRFFSWLGETIGGGVKAISDALIYIITFPSSFCDAFFNCDLSRLDPTYNGTISNNDIKIRNGLFQGTPSQVISRLYFETPQTSLGIWYSELSNLFGTVNSVNYYDGASVAQNFKNHVWLQPNSTGVTFGSFINGSNEIQDDPNNWLFQHEYGHYLQSQIYGGLYLFGFGLPSSYGDGGQDHDYNPVEQDANVRAFMYFNEKVSGFYDQVPYGDNHGWDFWTNPIDPNHTYDARGDYWDYANSSQMELIKSLIIGPNFDYINRWWMIF